METIEARRQDVKSKPTKTMGLTIARFPLETLLLALKQNTVGVFSLDVEGVEFEVLNTIPFDKIEIKVMTVEHCGGPSAIERYTSADLLQDKGYMTYKQLQYSDPPIHVNDLVFVKTDIEGAS